MINVSSIITIVVLALIIAVIFYFSLIKKGARHNFFWSYFVIILLSIWAISVWLSDTGPAFMGVAWVPILIGGILVAILVAVFVPNTKKRNIDQQGKNVPEVKARRTFNVFLLIFIMLLIILISIGYTVA